MSDFPKDVQELKFEADDYESSLPLYSSLSKCSFQWKIHNFSRCREINYYIHSPIFYSDQQKNIKWRLRLNPLNIIIVIECISDLINLTDYDIYLININGEKKYSEKGKKRFEPVEKTSEIKFTVNDISVGKNKEQFLPDDVLTIMCLLTVRAIKDRMLTAENEQLRNYKHSTKGEIKLSRDLQSLLESGNMSDVILRVGDEEMKAHRLILSARSTLFCKMLDDLFQKVHAYQDQIPYLDVPNISFDTLVHMVSFIYSGETGSITVDSSMDLLEASAIFHLSDLRDICANFLKSNLSVDNSIAILAHADRYGSDDLKREAIEFMSSRFELVVTTAQWKEKLKEQPHLAAELLFAISKTKTKGNK